MFTKPTTPDFNTSHVSINRSEFLTRLGYNNHFNTSHVSINPMLKAIAKCMVVYFNTSHVSINQTAFAYFSMVISISIHLMFLLIHARLRPRLDKPNFNTSHVSINPTLLSAFPFLLYLKFLENTSFFKFFPSVSQT